MKIVSNDNQTKTNSLDINASLKRSAIVSLNYAKIVSLIAFDASLLRTLWKLSVRIYSWLMRNCNCIVVSSLIAPFFFAVLSLKHFTAQHIDVQIALDNVSRFRCNESICHRLRCERKNGFCMNGNIATLCANKLASKCQGIVPNACSRTIFFQRKI